MQTLWSRAATVRGSCRCPQCLHLAKGVGRRATASATKRMPRYFTSSTFWYSGVFAVAATLDAGVKIERREQWDKAIAQVTQELGDGQTFNTKQTKEAQVEAEQSVEENARQYFPFGGLLEHDDVFHYVDPSRPRPRWPSHTGDAIETYRLAPLSIYANRAIQRKAEATPWTPKKLATVQTSIELFQIRLFQRLEEWAMVEEATSAVPEEYARYIRQDAETLRRQHSFKVEKLFQIKRAEHTLEDYDAPADHLNLCSYQQDDRRQFSRIAQELNSSILGIFKLQMNRQISRPALLAKLAYNLSFSSAPPNLNTYNIMLVGLARMHEPTLVKHVVASMAETHMRWNEVSLSAVLDFYTKMDNHKDFARLIERIRAKHGGLALARSDIGKIRADGRSKLWRDPENPSKIILLPRPTPMVFGSIIAGVLKFAGFDSALSICEGMGQEGWGLCIAGLTPLLQDCAARRDWTSGLAVWKQIQALKSKSKVRQGSEYVYEQIRLDTFAAMIRLCSRCKQEETFHVIWKQAVNAHQNSTERLVQLVKGKPSVSLEDINLPDTTPAADIDSNHLRDDAANEALNETGRKERPFSASGLRVAERTNLSQSEQLHTADRELVAQSIRESRDPPSVSLEKGQLDHQRPMSHKTDDFDRWEPLVSSTASSSVAPQTQRPVRKGTFDRAASSAQNTFLEQLDEGQLHGTLPLGHELEDYELRERPISTYSPFQA